MQPDPYGQQMQAVAPAGQTVIIQQNAGNGMATTSLVMGILTWVFALLTPVIGITFCLIPITVLLGIIFGHIGMSGAKKTGVGNGAAITGLILNYLVLIGVIAMFVLAGAWLNELAGM